MTKEDIVRILIKRDGITMFEAWDWVNQTQKEIDEALAAGTYEDIEEIVKYNLGLEPDYMDVFLW